jgi:hypothetical protein
MPGWFKYAATPANQDVRQVYAGLLLYVDNVVRGTLGRYDREEVTERGATLAVMGALRAFLDVYSRNRGGSAAAGKRRVRKWRQLADAVGGLFDGLGRRGCSRGQKVDLLMLQLSKQCCSEPQREKNARQRRRGGQTGGARRAQQRLIKETKGDVCPPPENVLLRNHVRRGYFSQSKRRSSCTSRHGLTNADTGEQPKVRTVAGNVHHVPVRAPQSTTAAPREARKSPLASDRREVRQQRTGRGLLNGKRSLPLNEGRTRCRRAVQVARAVSVTPAGCAGRDHISSGLEFEAQCEQAWASDLQGTGVGVGLEVVEETSVDSGTGGITPACERPQQAETEEPMPDGDVSASDRVGSVLTAARSKEDVWKLFEESFIYDNDYWLPSKKKVSFAKRFRHLKAPEMSQSWPLDVPDIGCLDYDAVKRLVKGTPQEQDVVWAISLVNDYDAYLALHPEGWKPQCTQKTKDFEGEENGLVLKKYIQPLSRKEVRQFVHGFTVPKVKKQKKRTVLDGRPQNEQQFKPPPVDLPGLHDIEEAVKKYSMCTEYDGTGWFHQFGLHPDIARHWVLRIGNERFAWMRMPMGWSYAVYIAHTVARELAKVDVDGVYVLVYIDNVYFFSNDAAAMAAARKIFEARCAEVSAKFEVSTETTDNLKVLGMQCNLTKKTVSLPASFMDKLETLMTVFNDLWWTEDGSGGHVRPTTHAIWKVFGAVTWATRVLGVKLCHYPRWVAWLCRRAGQLAHDPTLWGKSCGIWPSARKELWELLLELKENQPRAIRDSDGEHTKTIYTDASNIGYGFVFDDGDMDEVVSRKWSLIMRGKIIAERELFALVEGVEEVLRRSPGTRHVHVLCDNVNVVRWVQRGRGKSFWSNEMLTRLEKALEANGAFVSVEWIPSGENLADAPSRGMK